MKLNFKFKWDYVVFTLVIVVFIYLKGPQTLDLIKIQGTNPLPDEIQFESINSIAIQQGGPKALIFWATWCGPCTIELKRINSLIQQGQIKPERIVAISLDETSDVVLATAQERNYLFPIVWDKDFKISQKLKVNSTPTIFLQDKDLKISWATSGLSPTLELRMINHLTQE